MKQNKGLMMLKEKWQDEARHYGRVMESDMFTLALGRMGWGEKRFAELDKVLLQVHKEFVDDINEDIKCKDKDMWMTKANLDRELAQYVGTLFVPYDERYKY